MNSLFSSTFSNNLLMLLLSIIQASDTDVRLLVLNTFQILVSVVCLSKPKPNKKLWKFQKAIKQYPICDIVKDWTSEIQFLIQWNSVITNSVKTYKIFSPKYPFYYINQPGNNEQIKSDTSCSLWLSLTLY